MRIRERSKEQEPTEASKLEISRLQSFIINGCQIPRLGSAGMYLLLAPPRATASFCLVKATARFSLFFFSCIFIYRASISSISTNMKGTSVYSLIDTGREQVNGFAFTMAVYDYWVPSCSQYLFLDHHHNHIFWL